MHARDWINGYLSVYSHMAGSPEGDPARKLPSVLDILERVEDERAWLRSHRAEWVEDREVITTGDPWVIYRVLLLEIVARLTDLLQAHWDRGAATRRPDDPAFADADTRAERAWSRLDAASTGMTDVARMIDDATA